MDVPAFGPLPQLGFSLKPWSASSTTGTDDGNATSDASTRCLSCGGGLPPRGGGRRLPTPSRVPRRGGHRQSHRAALLHGRASTFPGRPPTACKRCRLALDGFRSRPRGALNVTQAEPAAGELDKGPCPPVPEGVRILVAPGGLGEALALVVQVAAEAGSVSSSACGGIGPVHALRRLCAPAATDLDVRQVRKGQGMRGLPGQQAFEDDDGLVQFPGALKLDGFVQLVVTRHFARRYQPAPRKGPLAGG
jgi:hypothetical protein